MGWRTPRTWAAGQLMRAHWLNEELLDNLLTLRGLNGYGVQLGLDEDQSIPSGETTPIGWALALWQLGTLWTSGSAITIPIDGYWSLRAVVNFAADPDGMRRIGYSLNGRKVPQSSVLAVTDVDKSTILSFRQTVALSAGDVVEITAYQTSGEELRVFLGSQTRSLTRATIHLVGTI